MSDCINIEVRERLPEWLHGTLSASERAVVDAHLATCAECAAELDVLRVAMATMRARPVPRIDTRAIVAALPKPATARQAPRRSFASQWRVAAAMTVIALGGISLATVRQYFGGVPTTDTLITVPQVVESTYAVTPAVDTPAAARQVGLTAGGISELGDDEIETLIGALDNLEAAPHVEPDTSAFIRIVSGATGGN